MIEIVDSITNLILMEIKETKNQAALKTGSKIKLFDSDIYIIKRLLIVPNDPTKLRIIVEKERNCLYNRL
jgi:hypothetical protein